MQRITADEAQSSLEVLIDQVTQTDEPILISAHTANAVLISEGHWRGIQETLSLASIPGMFQSIREGLNTPLNECDTELDW